MELNCPSLEYVYSMTWAEFQIRSFGYRRMQERKDLLFREVAWSSLIGSHFNPKKLPKSKDKFWQIGEKKSGLTEEQKKAIIKAKEQYHKEKQNG